MFYGSKQVPRVPCAVTYGFTLSRSQVVLVRSIKKVTLSFLFCSLSMTSYFTSALEILLLVSSLFPISSPLHLESFSSISLDFQPKVIDSLDTVTVRWSDIPASAFNTNASVQICTNNADCKMVPHPVWLGVFAYVPGRPGAPVTIPPQLYPATQRKSYCSSSPFLNLLDQHGLTQVQLNGNL